MRKILLFGAALMTVSGNAWAEASGICGKTAEDCAWRYDANTKTLIIEGAGDMNKYTYTGAADTINVLTTAEWRQYVDSTENIVVKGVKSIGSSAFLGFAGVTNIEIDDSVTEISGGAFNNLRNLKKLVLPDSVKTIGDWTFDNMKNLQEFVIPDSVISIGSSSFSHISLANTTVVCSGGGDTAKCDALLKPTGKNIKSVSRPSYKMENGNIVERYAYDEEGNKTGYTSDGRVNKYDTEGHLVSSTKSNADGSIYTYDADGHIKSIRGKKIYTVEEAEAVTAHGDKFHVRLTYK